MIKSFTIIAALFFCSFKSNGQTTFGVNFGFNSSNLAFTIPDRSFATDSRKGLYVGLTAEYKLNINVSIQPEVNFATVGAKTLGVLNRNTFKLNYVNVPILGLFNSEPFSFYGGPQVSYLISATGIQKINGQDTKYDIKGNFKSIDVSALLGVGYTMENGFGGDVRFQLGIINVADNKNPTVVFPGTGPDSKINVNAVQLGFHYKFLKKKIKKDPNR